jgi:hypothetical protein
MDLNYPPYQQALVGFQVVDLPMAYNSIFVILSSLKPLFFNSLRNESRLTTLEHKTPESNKSDLCNFKFPTGRQGLRVVLCKLCALCC